MEHIVHLLFALIRFELFSDPFPEDLKAQLTEENLSALYALSDKHDLAHLIGDALYKLGMLPKDSPTAAKFQKSQVLALYRYTKLEHERKQIFRVFEENSISFVPLKGTIIRSLYPQPHLRTSCDIDILIHREDTDRAIQQLSACLKYRTNPELIHFHDVSLLSPGDTHLELHFTLEENKDHLDRVLSKSWDYCSPIEEGRSEHHQSPEFFIFHHIVHMALHFLGGGCGIRPLADLYLLRKKMPYEESIVLDLCSKCGMSTFYTQAKALSDVWFGHQLHNSTTQKMEVFILHGGVYGMIDNAVAIRQKKRGGSLSYMLSRIFMPYRHLKVRYPILVKHKWLFPVMTIRRWFSLLLSPVRRKRVQKELKISNSMTQETQENVGALLSELGLEQA